jgi:hypothetical protein
LVYTLQTEGFSRVSDFTCAPIGIASFRFEICRLIFFPIVLVRLEFSRPKYGLGLKTKPGRKGRRRTKRKRKKSGIKKEESTYMSAEEEYIEVRSKISGSQ